MQFRRKFGLGGWLAVTMAPLYLLTWHFRSNHSNWHLHLALAWAALALFQALRMRFFYWEMDSFCLRRRRLWGKTEIPWQDVISVQGVLSPDSAAGRLAVYYKDPDPMSYRTSVLVYTQDRSAFLEALKGFAPQAKLEA